MAPRSRLNLLLNDGRSIAATTVGHTLWLRLSAGSVTVSSEPLDPSETSWQQVPALSLVVATAADFSIDPLDQGSS